jgi:hypothetical protein
MRTVRILVAVGVVFSWSWGASAATYVPFPSWWQWNPAASPDGNTREQYHSFQTAPNSNLAPDWTYDGYLPSQPDAWTLSGVLQYNAPAPAYSWGFYTDSPGPSGPPWLNDNLGALLAPDATLVKLMGNEHRDGWAKQFYGVVIGFTTDPQAGFDISVTSESGATVDVANEYFITDPSAPGWIAGVVEGTIVPQPDWERFTLHLTHASNQVLWIDSVYMGTYCEAVPEPTTSGLLVLGIVCMLGWTWRRCV